MAAVATHAVPSGSHSAASATDVRASAVSMGRNPPPVGSSTAGWPPPLPPAATVSGQATLPPRVQAGAGPPPVLGTSGARASAAAPNGPAPTLGGWVNAQGGANYAPSAAAQALPTLMANTGPYPATFTHTNTFYTTPYTYNTFPATTTTNNPHPLPPGTIPAVSSGGFAAPWIPTVPPVTSSAHAHWNGAVPYHYAGAASAAPWYGWTPGSGGGWPAHAGAGWTGPCGSAGVGLTSGGGTLGTGGVTPTHASGEEDDLGGHGRDRAPPSNHPFAPNRCTLGRAYYLRFPYPWNALPQASSVNANELLKISFQALPKFDGDRRNYLAWRSSFIPCVHLTTVDISFKVMLLRSCMQTGTARMREFLASVVSTPEGYYQAICTLEDRYGGDENTLLARQEALLSLSELVEGDWRTLETMHGRLGAFLLEWSSLGGGTGENDAGVIETLSFFASVMGRIETSYSLKYLDWLVQTRRQKGLSSLHVWLGEQLRHHRHVANYTHKRERRGGQDSEGAGRAKELPPSWLDRRPKERAFYLEDSWEEVEEEFCDVVAAVPGQEMERGTRRRPCPACQGDHALGRCEAFRALEPGDRRALLSRERRCYLCFQLGHNVGKCTLDIKCARCRSKHHTLLHGSRPAVQRAFVAENAETPEDGDPEAAAEALEYGLVARTLGSRVSLRTLTLWIENPTTGQGMRVNAMLDDGSTGAAFVSPGLAQSLALSGTYARVRTEGVGGMVSAYRALITQVVVRPLRGGRRFVVPAQVMDSPPAGTYQPVDWTRHQRRYPHLAALELTAPLQEAGVDLLLGNRCPYLMLSLEEVRGGEEEPVARRTPLGWTVTGPLEGARGGEGAEPERAFHTHLREVSPEEERGRRPRGREGDRQLLALLQKMLCVEDMDETEVLSPREEHVLRQVRDSFEKIGNQYSAACIWVHGNARPSLGKEQAMRRLRSLENSKYFRDARLRAAYIEVISDWARDGIIKEVTIADAKHLLPHFPIIKDSATTPVRVVMDCAVELNDYLDAGPNLLNEVVGVLLRFRSCRYSFSGDVKQMFLQIHLHAADKPYHCFFWRTDPQEEPRVWQFQRHVFGNAGSPFVAVCVVKHQAALFRNQHPQAVETLHYSTLIDDVLDSADTEEEARDRLAEIARILSGAGMKLAKYHSNSENVLRDVPAEQREKACVQLATMHAGEPGLKTLGVKYDIPTDSFLFDMETPVEQVWTKRKMLKTFPRLYDPLGFLLPYNMLARGAFSTVARSERAWDRQVDPPRNWSLWVKDLPEIRALSFPRYLCPLGSQWDVELHVFNDASETAYAAVAYAVARNQEGSASVLLQARAKIAPKGKLSVPRLELLSAELAVALREKTLKHVKFTPREVFHWTDSLTVLFWLKGDRHRYQRYVADKIQRIRRRTDLNEWRWVPTAENPADLPSRGARVSRLTRDDLWLRGPGFLATGNWPRPPVEVPTSSILSELEINERLFVARGALCPVLNLDTRGSYTVIFRALCRIAAWLQSVRPGVEPTRRATLWLLRQWQIPIVQKWTQKPTHATRKALGWERITPILDAEGLLRHSGRLRYADALPAAQREPYVLPKDCSFTKVFIRHLHQLAHHFGGENYTLAKLLRGHWVPRARALVRAVLQDCVDCKRRNAKRIHMPEAPLPEFRHPAEMKPVAFDKIAVDCAGPFRIKRGRSHETYYLLLLCCCITRAVRLEWLSSLSTEAFLQALARSASRGVNPTLILSDNGGNFVAANKILKALWSLPNRQQMKTARPDITWRFNPPYASHYGGAFERLIGAAKQALYHALPEHLGLTLEQFATALAQVEGVLNDRPLFYNAGDENVVAITPNHFLYGSASAKLHETLTSDQMQLGQRWELVKKATERFCASFKKQVLPFLNLTRTPTPDHPNLAPGDIVAYFAPTLSRKWPLAIVHRVHPGRDGRVRTVTLRTGKLRPGLEYEKHGNRVFRRDVRDLALILSSPVGNARAAPNSANQF